MKLIRIISWVLTVIFGLLFLINWFNALNIQTRYGSPGTSIPYILGMLIGCSIIPAIFWIITYFVEKKK
jgi:hypothetical protein